jgi:hypothetical protein
MTTTAARKEGPVLRSLKEMINYRIDAKDGWSGKVKDFLFDDLFFSIRYLVADTGRVLPGRRVLISPLLAGEPVFAQRRLEVELTHQQVKDSPSLTEDEPVSTQMRRYAQARSHGWPLLWSASEAVGLAHEVFPLEENADEDRQIEKPEGDPHLRSAKEVMGYDILAEDGSMGHVEDFIVEADTWILRYMVIDTRNWLPGGKKVLVSPAWIERMSWAKNAVSVGVTRSKIEEAPEFDPGEPVNRAYEIKLFDYYGRPVYWDHDQERSWEADPR